MQIERSNGFTQSKIWVRLNRKRVGKSMDRSFANEAIPVHKYET